MRQDFSLQRWGLLVKQHWAENKKRYLLSLAALMGLIIMWFVFTLANEGQRALDGNMQRSVYFVLLMFIGTFYASQFFNELGDKSKAINYLLTPASTLEKFLCALFFVVPLFFILFTAAFYLCTTLMVAIANALPLDDMHGSKIAVVNIFTQKNNPDLPLVILSVFFCLQAACMLGSVYFQKYSYIKTAIAIFLLFLAINFFEAYIIDTLMPGGFFKGFSKYQFMENGQPDKIVALPHWLSSSLSFVIRFGIPPLLWLVTYYRLKEKEV